MKMAVTGLGNFPSSPTAATISRHKNCEIVHFLPIFTLSWLVCARVCAHARGYMGNFIDFLRYSRPSKAASKSCLILSSSFPAGVYGINFKKVSREKDCAFSPCVDNRGHFSPPFFTLKMRFRSMKILLPATIGAIMAFSMCFQGILFTVPF